MVTFSQVSRYQIDLLHSTHTHSHKLDQKHYALTQLTLQIPAKVETIKNGSQHQRLNETPIDPQTHISEKTI